MARIVQWEIVDGPQKGPWFPARFPGTKSCCDDDIEVGEDIRADGNGGWEGRCCGDDERIPAKAPSKKQVTCKVCFMKTEPGACNCHSEDK